MTFQSQRAHWRLFNVNNSGTYLGFRVKCPIISIDFNRISNFSKDFLINHQYQISSKCVQWETPLYMRTDGQTNCLILFHWEGALWRQFHVAGNNKTYVGLHVMCPIFLLYFNQVWNISTNFHEVHNIRFNVNQASRSLTDTFRETDGRTDGHEGNRPFSWLCVINVHKQLCRWISD